jgi:hypothetical protein
MMKEKKKVWLVAADMGYGHQRAAYPLRDIAYERVINANSDKHTTDKEKKQWRKFLWMYELISRTQSIPIIGNVLWGFYGKFDSISPFYPFRDLSQPNSASLYLRKLIKKNLMAGIIDYVKKKDLPLVTTFFATAVAADNAGIKNLYCIVTDTDINRVWVSDNPKDSKIIYLAPTENAAQRLVQYGVTKNNIFYTGFPLPEENTGKNLEILKRDLRARLANLDTKGVFFSRYDEFVVKNLGSQFKKTHPLTLMYAVGGAGAQKKVAYDILASLKKKISEHKIRIILVAGTRLETNKYFHDIVEDLGLKKELGKYVIILCKLDKKSYFAEFNNLLHETDILWTKPSELCFYTALGIPILMTKPLGSHEELNKKWLIMMDAGLAMEDPKYTDDWLFDLLDKGEFAEAAYNGFLKAPKFGTENIKEIIFSKDKNKVKLRY